MFVAIVCRKSKPRRWKGSHKLARALCWSGNSLRWRQPGKQLDRMAKQEHSEKDYATRMLLQFLEKDCRSVRREGACVGKTSGGFGSHGRMNLAGARAKIAEPRHGRLQLDQIASINARLLSSGNLLARSLSSATTLSQPQAWDEQRRRRATVVALQVGTVIGRPSRSRDPGFGAVPHPRQIPT